MATTQKIIPNLWFDNQAEEAVQFYISIFKNSGIERVTHYTKEGFEIHGRKEGTVMTIGFHIDDQQYVALNGGPDFKFNEAISFIVNCETQEEVDYYWDKLSENGDPEAQQCGWLKDRFGMSWQIIPTILTELSDDPDLEKAQRVTRAMLQMKKLNISGLKQAWEGN